MYDAHPDVEVPRGFGRPRSLPSWVKRWERTLRRSCWPTDHTVFREGLARKLISYKRREDTGTREEQVLENNDEVSFEVVWSAEGPEARNVSRV